jgi:hypothetical protein
MASSISPPATRALTVDATAPSLLVSISDRELNAGETATVGFAFSDAPLGFTLSDATATGGGQPGAQPHGPAGPEAAPSELADRRPN